MEGTNGVRADVAERMVDHLVSSNANVANPSDPLAKLRRQVLRGLRAQQRL